MVELHLNLKKKWFDMVLSGEKKEEYREIRGYWSRIFHGTGIKIKGNNYHPTDVIIVFSNGYSKNRPQMRYFCDGLKVGFGKPEWGAKKDIQYYVLQIGEKLPF